MEKRFVKLYLHKSQTTALEKMLEKDEINIMSKSQIDENQFQYEFIVNATGSDKLFDRIEHDFSKIKDFHMYFFNIEAEIPRPKQSEEEKEQKKVVFQRLTRQELYNDINKDVTISVSYILLIIISSIIAGIGLIRDNSTIIIGSMVIAPFLGSNVSLAFSTTIGDRKTLLQSLAKLFTGIGISFLVEGLNPSSYWEEKNAKKYRIISLAIWIFLLSLMSYLLYIIF